MARGTARTTPFAAIGWLLVAILFVDFPEGLEASGTAGSQPTPSHAPPHFTDFALRNTNSDFPAPQPALQSLLAAFLRSSNEDCN